MYIVKMISDIEVKLEQMLREIILETNDEKLKDINLSDIYSVN